MFNSAYHMKCTECRSTNTRLICFIQKNGRVAFKVECDTCGGFSHMLRRCEIHDAIETMLERDLGISNS